MTLLPVGKCSNPMELTNALVVGYLDPALEGQNIIFACAPGQILNGSNSSMCMGNGEWKPDPIEGACTNTAITIDTILETTMIGNVHAMQKYDINNIRMLQISAKPYSTNEYIYYRHCVVSLPTDRG
jgi:hypothetical protein